MCLICSVIRRNSIPWYNTNSRVEKPPVLWWKKVVIILFIVIIWRIMLIIIVPYQNSNDEDIEEVRLRFCTLLSKSITRGFDSISKYSSISPSSFV